MIFSNLIQTNLRTESLGRKIEYYQYLNSTNDEALELVENGQAEHGMLVITDNQLKGKGRNGNSWYMAPSKGLAMSLILLEPFSLKHARLIPLATAVAVSKALKNRGANPKVKWPNDVLLHNKKCGGILCESRLSNKVTKYIIVGIGLNINESKEDFPKDLANKATSLSIETQHSNQRELVCAIILSYLEQLLGELNFVINPWLEFCGHINKKILFKEKENLKNGIFRGINSLGQAKIEINKKTRLFNSIDIIS
tara:strand:- start:95941 stop:96702 length:762 start_codon:yes stop_codon:yes gene_type:complete